MAGIVSMSNVSSVAIQPASAQVITSTPSQTSTNTVTSLPQAVSTPSVGQQSQQQQGNGTGCLFLCFFFGGGGWAVASSVGIQPQSAQVITSTPAQTATNTVTSLPQAVSTPSVGQQTQQQQGNTMCSSPLSFYLGGWSHFA